MAVIVPGAEWRPNPVSSRRINLVWAILHTIVGTVTGALSGRHYHIYVRADGSFVQIQDLLLRSAASVEANPYSIAIVAEDMGRAFPSWSGSNVPPYTSAQVDTIVRILVWICRRFGLPAEAVRDSCLSGTRGVAWHRLGISGNFPSWPSIFRGRRAGCQSWSHSFGKVCPGDARIRQINNVIIPRVRALLAGTPTPTPTPTPEDWFDMASEAQLREIVREENERAAHRAACPVRMVKEGWRDGDPVWITDLVSWKLEVVRNGPLDAWVQDLLRLNGLQVKAYTVKPGVVDAIPDVVPTHVAVDNLLKLYEAVGDSPLHRIVEGGDSPR